MTQIVEIRRSDDPRDLIHRACHLLANGELVAFCTETVYVVVAHALSTTGVSKLVALQPEGRRTLVLKSGFELWDYAPQMPEVADKLSRRGWPGPLTVALRESDLGGLYRDLSPEVKKAVKHSDQRVSFRVSAQETLLEVLRLCPAPLVASAERPASGGLPRTAADVASHYGDRVALILDEGSCRYGEPSTLVGVEQKEMKVLEPGVVSECTLQRLTSEVYVFVCTGNTCRSPMAEALFRKMLSLHLKCSDEELMDRGFNILSAGLSAGNGSPASREAVDLLAGEGIDLRNHESQQLTERLLLHADHVLTMTRGHRQSIISEYPDIADRVNLLSSEAVDIPDPYGGGTREYAACKVSIEENLKTLLTQVATTNS